MLSMIRRRSSAAARMALAAGLGLLPAHTLHSDPPEEPVGATRPVQVVNPPSEPVPVTGTVTGTVTVANTPDVRVVNTPTVNVGNTPAVNARQSGSWTVDVSALPPVALAPNATVGIDQSLNAVRIANDPAAPVPVRNVETGGLEPFHWEFHFSLADGQPFDEQAVDLPSGKRLVVEFVAGDADLPVGQSPLARVSGVVGNLLVRFPLAFNRLGIGITGGESWAASVPARIYAEERLRVSFTRIAQERVGSVSASVSVSGFLVDIP